jgi:ribosomal protein L29
VNVPSCSLLFFRREQAEELIDVGVDALRELIDLRAGRSTRRAASVGRLISSFRKLPLAGVVERLQRDVADRVAEQVADRDLDLLELREQLNLRVVVACGRVREVRRRGALPS